MVSSASKPICTVRPLRVRTVSSPLQAQYTGFIDPHRVLNIKQANVELLLVSLLGNSKLSYGAGYQRTNLLNHSRSMKHVYSAGGRHHESLTRNTTVTPTDTEREEPEENRTKSQSIVLK